MKLFGLLIALCAFFAVASAGYNAATDPQIIYSNCVNTAIVAHNTCTAGCPIPIGSERLQCLNDCSAQYQADQCACDAAYANAVGNPTPNC